MIELTPEVIKEVERIFPASEHERVKRLLETKCAETVPINNQATALERLDSIRCDTLVLSKGDIGELRRAIRLAHLDWRDLWVAADAIRKHRRGK